MTSAPIINNALILRQNIFKPGLGQSAYIDITLDHAQRVMIKIYSRRGKLVNTLLDREMNSGTYPLAWNGADQYGNIVGSGIYIIIIKAEDFNERDKIAVIH